MSSRGEIYPLSAANGNDISVVPKVGDFLYIFFRESRRQPIGGQGSSSKRAGVRAGGRIIWLIIAGGQNGNGKALRKNEKI